jgi:hypothetical protein
MNLGGGLTAFVLNGVSLDAIVGATSQIATELQYVALQHSNVALAGSRFMLSRSRGTLASPLIVADNDSLAAFDAAGYDGTDYVLAGEIDFEVDGTPGGNDMPGRIVLKTTADGGILPTARWTIDSTGHLKSGTDGTGAYDITTAGAIAANGVTAGNITTTGDIISSANSIHIKPSGDTGDYITLSTSGNIPSITATGASTLKIKSSSAVDFSNNNLTTTGNITGDRLIGSSLTISEIDHDVSWVIEAAGVDQITVADASFSPTTTNYVPLGTSTKLYKELWLEGKLYLSQADGNEYIDSLADGYTDYGATTGHRFNANVDITGTVNTTSDDNWDLNDYTAGTVTDTGYVTVTINGTAYKLLARLEP